MSNPTDREIAHGIVWKFFIVADAKISEKDAQYLMEKIEQAITEAKKGMYSVEEVNEVFNKWMEDKSNATFLFFLLKHNESRLTEYRKGR